MSVVRVLKHMKRLVTVAMSCSPQFVIVDNMGRQSIYVYKGVIFLNGSSSLRSHIAFGVQVS